MRIASEVAAVFVFSVFSVPFLFQCAGSVLRWWFDTLGEWFT